ncbi:MAG: Holliday junction branch migration protein RuvA [Patescibacteria group bacterium]
MLSYLRGQILAKLEKSVTLLVGDVGYEVTISAPLLEKMELGTPKEFFIHTHVREDALSLFGFETMAELKFFKKIIASVPGIGPKLGMDIMGIPLEKIKGAILNKDIAALQGISGVGKKIAERLVIEMRNKIEVGEGESLEYESSDTHENEEIMTALLGLGYKRNHIRETLKKQPEHLKKTEDIIRFFLQNA